MRETIDCDEGRNEVLKEKLESEEEEQGRAKLKGIWSKGVMGGGMVDA